MNPIRAYPQDKMSTLRPSRQAGVPTGISLKFQTGRHWEDGPFARSTAAPVFIVGLGLLGAGRSVFDQENDVLLRGLKNAQIRTGPFVRLKR